MQLDLTVVGAGIVGAMTAHLARLDHPGWRLGLIDRSLAGAGATALSAGLDLPFGQTAEKRRQSAESRRLFAELRRRLPGLPLHDLPLHFVVSEGRRGDLEEGLAVGEPRDADGVERAALAAALPELRLAEGDAVVTGCPGGYGDAPAVARALVADLRRGGATCWEGTAVREVRAAEGGFQLTLGDGRRLASRRVVSATGPWMLSGPGAGAARDAGLRTKKIVALHLDRRPRPGDPIVFFFDDDAFLLPLADRGHWLFSYACPEWDVDPDGPLEITARDREQALEILGRHCPGWESSAGSGRVFCDAYGPDWTPVVGEVEPGWMLAGGGSGSGYRLAPALARRALDLLAADRGNGGGGTGGGGGAAAAGPGSSAGAAPARRRRVMVTATPPTPNGDLHVGHLSGPYLAADVHRRYLRSRGGEALYLCGIDDHQSYTARKAEQLETTPAEVARRFGDRMVQTLVEADIEVDHVGRPDRSSHHRPFVERLFRDLWDRGHIVAREAETLYCPACEEYLYEVFVSGRCPHCGNPSAGNSCEDCGRPNDCADLVEPRCLRCGGVPERPRRERLYFPLEPHRQAIGERLAGAAASAHLRSLWEAMAAGPLPEVSVSNLSDWGIPVPVERFADQRIYCWFEMAPGYLAAGQELAEELGLEGGWRELWASGDTGLVQFFGFDNGYFHAVLFPAVFAAWDPAIRPPDAFVVNEFYRLDGDKFSTSRNHAIWGGDVLPVNSTDALRFYLAWSGPETARTNFVHDRYAATVERELDGRWRPWLRALRGRVEELAGGRTPGAAPATPEQRAFLALLESLRERLAGAYEAATFSPQRAVRTCSEIVREANRFAAAEDHWPDTPAGRRSRLGALAAELVAARLLALGAAPVMPDFGAALLEALGSPPGGWDAACAPLPADLPVGDLDGTSFPTARP